MSIKNTLKSIFIWFMVLLAAACVVAIIVIPPMTNLDFLKPKIENVILTKTGIPAKIEGNVNFSLLGRATIVANDITIPNGTISSCKFTIPFSDIFDIQNAQLSGYLIIDGASISVDKIEPFNTDTNIFIHDSTIHFLNKDYKILSAELSKKHVEAIVRTKQHKYELKSNNRNFVIRNKNNELVLVGELNPDGSATAHIDITAQNINKWFEFSKPRITGQFPVSADISWNGKYGITFSNISAGGITGSVTLQEDGYKIIKLKSNKANYDLSFFLNDSDLFQDMSFDLDFYGTLRFADNVFHHVKIVTVGSKNEIKVDSIIADDLHIHGGTIDKDGGHNLHVSVPEFGVNTTCLFNGTPLVWSCDNFSYGGLVKGTLYVDTTHFEVDLTSPQPFSDFNTVIKMAQMLGTNGYVKFDCPDMKGTMTLTNNKPSISYTHLIEKSLNWAKVDLPFIPDFMKQEKGKFTWTEDSMIFTPNSGQWQLSTTKDFFIIHGDNFKKWLPNLDLQALRDLPYSISGKYKKGTVSNLIIEIAHQRFTGSASKKSVTLKTNILNLDDFINPYFTQNFEELSFFTNAPILIPFDIGANIALSSNALIYKSRTYNNFVYSLQNEVQTFSITDKSRGNILATITKDKTNYDLDIQLNKFVFNKQILPQNMPLNISDTMVTGNIHLNTYGKIAHDITDNLNGTFDLSFDGGKLYGFGFADFYASASNMTILNGEYALYTALKNGITPIKNMHIKGVYKHSDIRTIQPLTLSMKHVDATGILEITNQEMYAELNLVLRGTSPSPQPIDIKIYPDNKREFSLSEIMTHFNAEYMRKFVKSHDKF